MPGRKEAQSMIFFHLFFHQVDTRYDLSTIIDCSNGDNKQRPCFGGYSRRGEAEHTDKWTHKFLWYPKRESKLGKESLGRLHGYLRDAVLQVTVCLE